MVIILLKAVPSIGTRVKMGKTSNVIAAVKSDGKVYTASKEVKVTIGGCEVNHEYY